RSIGRPVKFLFPSSIAVYGLGNLSAKRAAGRVAEDVGLAPITMYGCGKLYCEHLGRHYARHYRQLAAQSQPAGVDFRSIRFPPARSVFCGGRPCQAARSPSRRIVGGRPSWIRGPRTSTTREPGATGDSRPPTIWTVRSTNTSYRM